MKGGAWNHRRSYITRWIYQITALSRINLDMSKKPITDESYAEAQREEDAMEEARLQNNISMPSMKSISENLGKMQIEAMKEKEGERWGDDEEELNDLLEQKTPVLPHQEEFQTPTERKGKEKDAEPEQEEDDEVYEESFASQRETSQLREEFEVMSEEVRSLKSTISALLKEREALPGHLSVIREDINQQMTLMLSKLQFALESDVTTSNIKAASAAVTDAKERSADRLAAAVDYANDQPRETSPIANKGAELKGKRRFRPVK